MQYAIVPSIHRDIDKIKIHQTCLQFYLTHNIRIPDPGQKIYSCNEGNKIVQSHLGPDHISQLL
jgi:hypothetical protein